MRQPPVVAFVTVVAGAALMVAASVGTASASCSSNPTCNPQDPVTGPCCNVTTCEWKSNGSACDDRNDCTSSTTCGSGHVCDDGVFSGATTCRERGVDGVPLNCRSGQCNGTTTCTLGADACEDGDPCTDDCQDTTSITCYSSPHPYKDAGEACDADSNPCTVDACNASHQCVLDHNVVCPSSNPPECKMDQCQPSDGSCDRVDKAPNTPCTADNNQCSKDICNNGNCTHPADTGAACSDGNPCTLGERCNHNKDCGGGGSDEQGPYAPTPATPGDPCPSDNNPCTYDYCTGVTVQTAACSHDAVNVITQQNTQGNACDDGKLCSAGTTCDVGSCAGPSDYCDTSVFCPACQVQCGNNGAPLPQCGCSQ